MSQFVIAETKVTNLEDIIAALIEIGILREQIEVHNEPVALSGWGSQDKKAEVVVRKQHLAAHYGDLGATKYTEDGTKGKYYKFIVDDLDCKGSGETCSGNIDRRWDTRRGGFINHVAGRAGVISAERKLRRRGFKTRRIEKRNKDGKLGGMRLECVRSK